jgi:MFS family permease
MFKPTLTPPAEAGDVRTTINQGRGLLVVLLVGQAMATMDGSILVILADSIRIDLPASDSGLRLILSGYLLAFAVLVVTGARLGDRWGQRRAFLVGLTGFTLASLVCGLAPDTATLVTARVAQGMAGALMVPQVLSVIQLQFTGPRRARAIGLYSMVLALGVSLGQLLGGLIVTIDPGGAGWRAAFLINVPVGLVLYPLAARGLRAVHATGRPALDVGGVGILSAAMIGIVVPLVFGPEAHWPLWTFVLLLLGAAGLAVFVWYERWLSRRGGAPLLDLDAVRLPDVRAALASCVLIMGAYFGFVLVFTLDLQIEHGYSPLGAALAFVPYASGFATASLTWTRIAPERRWLLPLMGPIAFAVGVAGTALLGGPVLPALPLLFLAGLGHAGTFSPLVGTVVERVGPGYASAVSALTTTAPQIAAVLSYAGIGGLYLTSPPGTALPRVGLTIGLIVLACFGCVIYAVRRPNRIRMLPQAERAG